MYEELRRKNHQITNGNSLNSIDLLINTSNDTVENQLNGSTTNIEQQNGHTNGHQNGHTNGHSTDNSNHNSSLEEEEINNEDSTNQISSLETDNAHNGASFNESIELEINNENL